MFKAFDGEIEKMLESMLELAGDKSEHGKRQPGEKCMYEIQRVELSRESWEEGQKREKQLEKDILSKVIDDVL